MDSPFVANVRDLPWMSSEAMGDICTFESGGRRFEQVGYNLAVLQPGQRGAQYHRELDNQEDFLVLAGACIAIVEGEEHRLGSWDFVHCPPGIAHAFLAVGDGIGVEVETTDQAEAYAALPKWRPGTPSEELPAQAPEPDRPPG